MTGIVAGWAHLYNNSGAVSTAVTYVHFAGVLVGGGLALAADRDAFRPSATLDPQVHRWVVGALGFVLASGVLMFLADLDTYLTSTAFWVKMALLALLVANGYARIRAEQRPGPWLRRTSAVSAGLWLAVLLASTTLNS